MDAFNPLLSNNRMGQWERATNSDGIVLNRVPIIAPYIQSLSIPEGHFIFSALSPLAVSTKGAPVRTINDLLGQPNVVYFERELTGPRVEAWMYISQLGRIILRCEQIPEGNVSSWLKAIGPLLGPSATTITKTAPSTLSLARTSYIGLSGAEIHLLADWLASSEFPLRLHSQVAKLPRFASRHSGTVMAPGQGKQKP